MYSALVCIGSGTGPITRELPVGRAAAWVRPAGLVRILDEDDGLLDGVAMIDCVAGSGVGCTDGDPVPADGTGSEGTGEAVSAGSGGRDEAVGAASRARCSPRPAQPQPARNSSNAPAASRIHRITHPHDVSLSLNQATLPASPPTRRSTPYQGSGPASQEPRNDRPSRQHHPVHL